MSFKFTLIFGVNVIYYDETNTFYEHDIKFSVTYKVVLMKY